MFGKTERSIVFVLGQKEPSTLTKDRAIAEELRISREQVRQHLEQLQAEQFVEVEEILGTCYARLTEDGRSKLESNG